MRVRSQKDECKNHKVGEILNCDACDGIIDDNWCLTRYPWRIDSDADMFNEFFNNECKDN